MHDEQLVNYLYDFVVRQLQYPGINHAVINVDVKPLVVRVANKLRQDKIYVCVIDELPAAAKRREEQTTQIFQLVTIKKEYNGKE